MLWGAAGGGTGGWEKGMSSTRQARDPFRREQVTGLRGWRHCFRRAKTIYRRGGIVFGAGPGSTWTALGGIVAAP